jgi:hypothetical protein
MSVKCYDCVSVFLPLLSAKNVAYFLRRVILLFWPVWLCHILPHVSLKDTIFG